MKDHDRINEQFDRRFSFTGSLNYELHFSNYYGDGNQIAEGSYFAMRDRAARKLRAKRKQHAITSLNRGWRWEVEDDGEGLVDDRCGVMSIRCIESVLSDDDFYVIDDDEEVTELVF